MITYEKEEKKGYERNMACSEAEIDKMTEDTDRQIAAVKEFSSFYLPPKNTRDWDPPTKGVANGKCKTL